MKRKRRPFWKNSVGSEQNSPKRRKITPEHELASLRLDLYQSPEYKQQYTASRNKLPGTKSTNRLPNKIARECVGRILADAATRGTLSKESLIEACRMAESRCKAIFHGSVECLADVLATASEPASEPASVTVSATVSADLCN